MHAWSAAEKYLIFKLILALRGSQLNPLPRQNPFRNQQYLCEYKILFYVLSCYRPYFTFACLLPSNQVEV